MRELVGVVEGAEPCTAGEGLVGERGWVQRWGSGKGYTLVGEDTFVGKARDGVRYDDN